MDVPAEDQDSLVIDMSNIIPNPGRATRTLDIDFLYYIGNWQVDRIKQRAWSPDTQNRMQNLDFCAWCL